MADFSAEINIQPILLEANQIQSGELFAVPTIISGGTSNVGEVFSPGGASTKYYKMTGYYSMGSTYESFVATGSPSASSAINPNTGHALVNIYVADTW